MRKVLEALLLGAGIAAALWLFHRHGAPVGEALRRVGWGLLPYLGVSLAVYLLDAWGWRCAFPKEPPRVGFFRLFSVRMAGEAVNRITPLASLGGEPLKAYLLARDGARFPEAFASVAAAKQVMTLAQIVFVLGGVAVALPRMPQHRALLLALAVFPALVLGALGAAAVLDLSLRRVGVRPGRSSLPVVRAAAEFWALTADFFRTRPRQFALSFALFLLAWLTGALELIAGARALGIPLEPGEALVMEALLASVTMATFFVPANAGSQEGGFAAIAPLFGLSAPHGLALALLRRCREAVWVAFGLLYLAVREPRWLREPPRASG